MTDYKAIFGKKIKFLTTDLSNAEAEGEIFYSDSAEEFKVAVSSAAWSSASPMINDNSFQASSGTQPAGITCGGYQLPASLNVSESYDGTSWTVYPTLGTGRYYIGAHGATVGAAMGIGGLTTGSATSFTNITEEFNETATVRTVDTST